MKKNYLFFNNQDKNENCNCWRKWCGWTRIFEGS